jgi:hypothetical protein
MIKDRDRHRVGQARLLRRQGKTYDEIRAVIGPVDNKTLLKWVRGIPRPPETRRSHAHRELAKECRRLRAGGFTLGEIVAKTGAAAGSVSVYIRGVRVPPQLAGRRQAHLEGLRGKGGKAMHDAAMLRRSRRIERARGSIGEVTNRDLFVVGVALYWAEGSKDKPWRRSGRVSLINSDPTVLHVFLAWLDLVGVPETARRYRLSIHESADAAMHERWWAETLQVPVELFYRATLKRHNPTPSRHNRDAAYHGCLVVSVARSIDLYDAIDGWWQALASRAATRI